MYVGYAFTGRAQFRAFGPLAEPFGKLSDQQRARAGGRCFVNVDYGSLFYMTLFAIALILPLPDDIGETSQLARYVSRGAIREYSPTAAVENQRSENRMI